MLSLDDIRHLVRKISCLRIDRHNLRYSKVTLIVENGIHANRSTRNKDAYDMLVEILQEVNPQLITAGYASIRIPPRPVVLSERQKEKIYDKQKKIMKQKLRSHKRAFLNKVKRSVKFKSHFQKTLEKRRRRKERKKMQAFEARILYEYNVSLSDLSNDDESDSY